MHIWSGCYGNVPKTIVITVQCIIIIGKWSVPIISGQRPPPCDDLTLKELSHNKGIMFGSGSGHYQQVYDDVFIVELMKGDTVVRYTYIIV